MGGWRILAALSQILANVVDYNEGLQAAITTPRIDLSTGRLQASDRLPAETLGALRAMGYETDPIEEDVHGFGFGFASPVAVLREPDGTLRGGADAHFPAWAVGID